MVNYYIHAMYYNKLHNVINLCIKKKNVIKIKNYFKFDSIFYD